MLTCLLLALCCGEIAYGTPIPAADWQYGANLHGCEAIVLEDRTLFLEKAIERYRKVHILSERGKAAVEFVDLTGTARKLEGRVVDVHGEETAFGQRSDLVELVTYKGRGDLEKVRLLVPPGLSRNCIVELAWTIPAEGAIPLGRDAFIEAVAEVWPVRNKSFSFTSLRNHPGWQLGNLRLVSQPLWTTGADDHFRLARSGGRQTVAYLELPARAAFPFGNDWRYDNSHFVQVVKTFPDFGHRARDFWKDVCQNYVRAYLFGAEFKPSPEYRAWVAELKAQRGEEPVQAMSQLLRAFRARMASTRMARWDQRFADAAPEDDLGKRLLAAFQRGAGDSYELNQLFYRVVTDVGQPFVLVFPSSTEQWPFDADARQPFYFNYYPLYGVPQGQELMLFAPERYEYGPGYFPNTYEGLEAMVVDPRARWQPRFTVLQGTGAESNRMVSHYTTELQPDFGYSLALQRKVTGAYGAAYRQAYYGLPPAEKNEALAAAWRDLGVFVLTEATVEGADELEAVITEKIALKVEKRPLDVSSYAFHPFPNSVRPLRSPHTWPPNRDQDLFLDFAKQHIDLNTITVPDGWVLSGVNDWHRRNAVGEVAFQAVQAGNKVTVRRDLTVSRNRYPRTEERQLKAFLAWVDEAFEQTIAFALPQGAP